MAPKKRPAPGRVYPFSYFVTRKEKRTLKVHQRRDLGAAIELLPPLFQLGWKYGEPILNFPPDDIPLVADDDETDDEEITELEPDLEHEILPMDLEFLGRGDVILQTTRPPLDDWGKQNRKKVQRGFTELEDRLLTLWREYLVLCARSHVRVQQRFVKKFVPGRRNRREMRFMQRMLAEYRQVGIKQTETPANRTAAFLLRLDEIWEGGPGLLGAFGMDGTTSQVWAYRLARDLPELLDGNRFVVAELEFTPVPDRPLDLRWANEWGIEILLDHPL